MHTTNLRYRLSQNLKRLRKSAHLTQFQLAERADISPDTINSIESQRMWASDVTLQKICGALETDAVSLLLPCGNDVEKEEFRVELHQIAVAAVKRILKNELNAIC